MGQRNTIASELADDIDEVQEGFEYPYYTSVRSEHPRSRYCPVCEAYINPVDTVSDVPGDPNHIWVHRDLVHTDEDREAFHYAIQ